MWVLVSTASAWCVPTFVWVCIHSLFLSITVNSKAPPSLSSPFPRGAHYLLVGFKLAKDSSIWKWSITQGLWSMQRKELDQTLWVQMGNLELSHRESFFHSVHLWIFIFQVMHYHCCSSDTPCHTGVQIIINLALCLQLAVHFGKIPAFFFGGGALCPQL